jgi:hypothetical protein
MMEGGNVLIWKVAKAISLAEHTIHARPTAWKRP